MKRISTLLLSLALLFGLAACNSEKTAVASLLQM